MSVGMMGVEAAKVLESTIKKRNMLGTRIARGPEVVRAES